MPEVNYITIESSKFDSMSGERDIEYNTIEYLGSAFSFEHLSMSFLPPFYVDN